MWMSIRMRHAQSITSTRPALKSAMLASLTAASARTWSGCPSCVASTPLASLTHGSSEMVERASMAMSEAESSETTVSAVVLRSRERNHFVTVREAESLILVASTKSQPRYSRTCQAASYVRGVHYGCGSSPHRCFRVSEGVACTSPHHAPPPPPVLSARPRAPVGTITTLPHS